MNALRAFEAAGRHVSFTKAAAELGVTHGAVSRQVASLEAWLGVPLFRRTAAQLALTDAGREYLAELTPMLNQLALVSMQLKDRAAPAVLRVNAPPTFAMRWLIPRLPGFQLKRPDVEVLLTTSLAPVNFDEGKYDIAIAGAHEPLSGCVSRPFMTELIVPVCHVDLVETNGLTEPAGLAHHALLSYATEPYSWPDWLAAVGLPRLRPRSSLKFEQMFFALQAAVGGLGVVLVPLFLAIDDIIAGRLCTPFGLLAARQRQYFANTPRTNAVMESFWDWLRREGRDTEQSIEQWTAGRPGAPVPDSE
ncbi:LysR substrate-binding domain-containing protein [Pigmentiphaga soli]|uniref:LysR substrate-binding domain-containing protein n=1 Tax=Pigmentiphaga soli TaxID=1007095 RepID=A0ABP8H2P5_9BURK